MVIEPPEPNQGVDEPRAAEPPLLTGQRRVLVEALSAKSTKSGRAIRMYEEALQAIRRDDGPEALHVAAYELREMMGALPALLDLPVVHPDSIRNRVQRLSEQWQACADRSTCRKGAVWDGQLDGPLQVFIKEAIEFFKWVEDDIPTRAKEAAAILGRLLPAESPMPQALIDKRTSEWKEIIGFFNSLTHHNSDPVPARFFEQLEALEVLLLEHLAPRTFEDQDEIDRLIRDVEDQ